jgi:cobyrinic acid a,c-diamide synthase
MMITRQTVRDQILAYLNHQVTLAQLVDWAENAINESTVDPKAADVLSDVIARIGVADVEGFGLSWEDCYDFLSRLGYKVEVMAA